jgi:MFS family permease
MFIYFGLTAGDFFSGPLSQWLHSRRKAIGYIMFVGAICAGVYLFGGITSPTVFYIICFLSGICTGYIGLYLMMVAELYGTNLRATATTSVPSIVRGMAIPMTLAFQAFKPSLGTLGGAAILGALCYGLALFSLTKTEETYGKALDFMEE